MFEVRGGGMALALSGPVTIPAADIRCPKYFTSGQPKKHIMQQVSEIYFPFIIPTTFIPVIIFPQCFITYSQHFEYSTGHD